MSRLKQFWAYILQKIDASAADSARIDPDAKCPACGARQGTLTWRSDVKQVQHRCAVCGALWGEPPLMIGFGGTKQ